MAAPTSSTIELHGNGCHAAMPHLGRDPIVAAALMIQALQTLVAREVDPIDSAVISITRIHGGDAYNVVPEPVELWGTIRTFRPTTRDLIERRLSEVVAAIAWPRASTARSRLAAGYPATINMPREAALGADAAAEIVGEAQVDRAPRARMGSEDFAFMLEQRPGSYIWMGTGGGGQRRSCTAPTTTSTTRRCRSA